MKLAFINNIKICKRKMLVLLCTLPVSLQIHACILCNIVDKILKTQAKKIFFAYYLGNFKLSMQLFTYHCLFDHRAILFGLEMTTLVNLETQETQLPQRKYQHLE